MTEYKNLPQLIKLVLDAKITRRVDKVIFHTTATPQTATVESILRYWRNTLGWRNPGYHIIVRPDGNWSQLADFNLVTNGVRGHNANSIHISYIGGIDSQNRPIDNRTVEQQDFFAACYHLFRQKLPHVTFHGHNEFANKACPCFNVAEWIKTL